MCVRPCVTSAQWCLPVWADNASFMSESSGKQAPEHMSSKIETTIVYLGYIGIMEKKMETTVVYWGYIGSYLFHEVKGSSYNFSSLLVFAPFKFRP